MDRSLALLAIGWKAKAWQGGQATHSHVCYHSVSTVCVTDYCVQCIINRLHSHKVHTRSKNKSSTTTKKLIPYQTSFGVFLLFSVGKVKLFSHWRIWHRCLVLILKRNKLPFLNLMLPPHGQKEDLRLIAQEWDSSVKSWWCGFPCDRIWVISFFVCKKITLSTCLNVLHLLLIHLHLTDAFIQSDLQGNVKLHRVWRWGESN